MTTQAKVMNGDPVEWAGDLEDQVESAMKRLAAVGDLLTRFVVEKPILCLSGALALGYVFGKVVRR